MPGFIDEKIIEETENVQDRAARAHIDNWKYLEDQRHGKNEGEEQNRAEHIAAGCVQKAGQDQ